MSPAQAKGLSAAAAPLFAEGQKRIGFADVGSGGPLKLPWSSLPTDLIDRLEFDPETSGDQLPLCVSNIAGEKDFYLTRDPRGSSLHQPNEAFVERFGMDDLLVDRTIKVRCDTLDEIVRTGGFTVDLLDINTEGHDLQVLQGSEAVFENPALKLIKIEFELAAVWHGQGYFADIDRWLRERGFELCEWEHDVVRQANSSHLLLGVGEPVWGKGWYAPSSEKWQARRDLLDAETWSRECSTAAAVYTVCGFLGRALEMITLSGGDDNELRVAAHRKRLASGECSYCWGEAMTHLNQFARWVKRALSRVGKG